MLDGARIRDARSLVGLWSVVLIVPEPSNLDASPLVSSSLTQAHPASARGSRHVDGARIRSLVGIRGRADRVLGVVLPCHHLLTESHRRHHDGHGTSCDSLLYLLLLVIL